MRWVAAVLLVALVAAACGSDDDPDSAEPDGGGSSSTVAAEPKEGPIKLGFVVFDINKTLTKMGMPAGVDPQDYWKALIEWYNANGGLNGRTIEPVFYSGDASAADLNADEQAACSTMTEDNKVEAVLSMWLRPILASCLNDAGVPYINGHANEAGDFDRKALTDLPNVFLPNWASKDRSIQALIETAVKSEWIGDGDTLGVVADNCPATKRTLDAVVEPLAEKNGFTLTSFTALDCTPTSGEEGMSKFTSGIQNAAFRLKADGATHVMFSMGGESTSLLFFTMAASSQQWNPTYLLTSNSTVQGNTAEGGSISKEQAANMRGIGWVPMFDDVASWTTVPKNKQTDGCMARYFDGGGNQPANAQENANVFQYCSALEFFDTVLQKTKGNADLASFQAAAEDLGSAYVSPLTIDGVTEIGPGLHDGASLARPFAYEEECTCIRYIGSEMKLPS